MSKLHFIPHDHEQIQRIACIDLNKPTFIVVAQVGKKVLLSNSTYLVVQEDLAFGSLHLFFLE